jgi:hypothetical protein
MNKILPFLFAFALFAQLSFGTSPFPMNIISNTIYQNVNATPLSIYVTTHSATLSGYMGSNQLNMSEAIKLTGGSVTVTSVVYSLAGYNMSAYLLVEPNEYYKFNFTDANFIGQYAPATGYSYVISIPTISESQYSGTAQILFAAGMILSIALLLLLFRILKFNIGIMGGLGGFAVGMVGALLLIFSLQFTSLVQAQPYTMNSINSTLAVQSQSVATTPLATQPIFAIVGYSFTLIDFILGFIYIFLAMLVYREGRIKRKYGR